MLGRFCASNSLKSVFQLTGKAGVGIKKNSFCTGLKLPSKKLQVLRRNPIWLDCVIVQFHNSATIGAKKKTDTIEELDEFQSLPYYQEFQKREKKDKETFLETVRIYKTHVKNRASHIDFIKAALKQMRDYGVDRDLECYKKILDILPKGVYIIKNRWMRDAFFFPRQQYVAIDLLDQMGQNGIALDAELGMIIINIFGVNSAVNRKYENMLYWSLKWKNASPFKVSPLPSEPLELAKAAIDRITSVDLQTEVSVFQTDTLEESVDKTWIVSGQSPKQKKLLQQHPHKEPVIVQGADTVWLGRKSINYFVLKSDGEPLPFIYPENLDDVSNLNSKYFNPNYKETKKNIPSVHEQDDGKIYAVCATGTSSKDSLLSWVRILQKNGNPNLANVPVLFRFYQKETIPAVTSEALAQQQE